MVFSSITLFARYRNLDSYWRKRRVFKLVAHLKGRRRNCYSNSIRALFRSLMFSFRGRKFKRMQFAELWEKRLNAACAQHGMTWNALREGLQKKNILLNRKTLVDLSIWEPRTFQSLTKLAYSKANYDGLNSITNLEPPKGVVTRGMLK